MSIKVSFISLGCPKNQVDSEVMLSKLANAGMETASEEIYADVAVINTCAFIESAKKEAIENILETAKLRKSGNLKGIVVTGCLAQRYKEEIFKELPEVDAICGVGNLGDIADAVKYAYEHGGQRNMAKFARVSFPEAQLLGEERIITGPKYSTYLKISEGCDNRCTYCIIPYIRGKFRSRRIEDIVEEAKKLVSLGAREITLVSQDTTRYGYDIYNEYKLSSLMKELCKIPDLKWLRILYCYPESITEELCDTIANEDKIVKYIDMPIQHISDRVLRAMNRRGDSELIKNCIKMIREKIPDAVIRTTVIVGFPGETKEDFKLLSDFLSEVKFDRLGVFTYSAEEGTPAARIKEGKVSEKIKQKRLDILMKNQFPVHENSNRKYIGRTLEVLCEGFDIPAEIHYGRSMFDAPEIDGKVFFSSKKKIPGGTFVHVKITDAEGYDLYGEICD